MASLDTELEQELTRAQQPHGQTGWRTVVWNDPVNLMSYVTWVFRTHFGFDEQTAVNLMLRVHHDGRAVVAHGPRETMEAHVRAMHDYGLWATLEPEPT